MGLICRNGTPRNEKRTAERGRMKQSGKKVIAENFPAKERRNYYEMLKNSADNPYDLDWNMELKKSR